MQKTFIGILLLIVIVVIFALQNSQEIYVDFWFWSVNSTLSMVIVLSVTFGALSSFLLSLPYRARKNKEIKEKDEKIRFFEEEISRLNPENSNLKSENNTEPSS